MKLYGVSMLSGWCKALPAALLRIQKTEPLEIIRMGLTKGSAEWTVVVKTRIPAERLRLLISTELGGATGYLQIKPRKLPPPEKGKPRRMMPRPPRSHPDCAFCGCGGDGIHICGECKAAGIDGPVIRGTSGVNWPPKN